MLALAFQASAQRAQPPVIIAFAVHDSAATISRSVSELHLAHRVTGLRPLEFRVSARADFAGALWQPYRADLRLSGWVAYVQTGMRCNNGMPGDRLTLFLQVRADIGSAVQIVNGQRAVVPQRVESNVVSDNICVGN